MSEIVEEYKPGDPVMMNGVQVGTVDAVEDKHGSKYITVSLTPEMAKQLGNYDVVE